MQQMIKLIYILVSEILTFDTSLDEFASSVESCFSPFFRKDGICALIPRSSMQALAVSHEILDLL